LNLKVEFNAFPIGSNFNAPRSLTKMFKQPKNISIPKLSPLPEPIQQPAHLSRAKPVPEHIDIKDPLAIGIFYHENGDLLMSAFYFSIAASRGDATGLFLFAISKRHGWGVEPDEKEAFRLLSLVTDRASMEEDLKQVTSTFQIPLALFEVGTAFQQVISVLILGIV
jgi:hypothetical protein